MQQTSVHPITRHDYQEMPEGPPYFQIIEGDLIMSPSPSTFHQQIVLEISFAIRSFLAKQPIGKVFVAPLDVFLSETNVFQPDIIFVRNEHRSIITDHGIEGGPDLVVEILSPRTTVYDRGSKRKIYARTGVRELWLVDPDRQTVQVFDLQADAEEPLGTYGPAAVFASAVLPGLKFQGAAIFKK